MNKSKLSTGYEISTRQKSKTSTKEENLGSDTIILISFNIWTHVKKRQIKRFMTWMAYGWHDIHEWKWITWMNMTHTKPHATTTCSKVHQEACLKLKNALYHITMAPIELDSTHFENVEVKNTIGNVIKSMLRSSSLNAFFVRRAFCVARWVTIDWIDSSVWRTTSRKDCAEWGIKPAASSSEFLETTLEQSMHGNVPEAPLHSTNAFKAASSEMQSFSSPTIMIPPANGSRIPLSNSLNRSISLAARTVRDTAFRRPVRKTHRVFQPHSEARQSESNSLIPQ